MTIILDGTTGITTPTTSATGEFVTSVTGFKNRIINGAMVIDQRNAGAQISNPAGAGYTVDRWNFTASQATKFNIRQNLNSVTPPAGFTNYLGLQVSNAVTVGSTEYFFLGQAIEGFNTADLDFGKSTASAVTISFWVYSSLTGTFGGSLQANASLRAYAFNYTISSANTWEKKTIAVAGDTTGTWVGATNGIGMNLYLGLGIGSNYTGTANTWSGSNTIVPTGTSSLVATAGATFYITGVQLEKGSTATSFDYRDYGTELVMCQRYYEKSYDQSIVPGTLTDNTIGGVGGYFNTTVLYGNVLYKVVKRIIANTVTIYAYDGTSGSVTLYNAAGNSGATGCTAIKIGDVGFTGVTKSGGTAFIASAIYWYQWTSSAEL
jgi:hypothetical protein